MSERIFPEFSEYLAELFLLEHAFVSNVIRRLREAGELEQSKRGFGALPVSSEAAAKTLLGVILANRPSDAPERVRTYGALHTHPDDGSITLLEKFTAFINYRRGIVTRLSDGYHAELEFHLTKSELDQPYASIRYFTWAPEDTSEEEVPHPDVFVNSDDPGRSLNPSGLSPSIKVTQFRISEIAEFLGPPDEGTDV